MLAHRSARSVRIGEQLGRHFIRRCRRINLEFGIGISQVRIENVARVVRCHTAVGRYALHVVCTQEITCRAVEQELIRTGRKHELVARRRQRIDLTAGIDDSEFVERYVLPNLRLAARTPAEFDLGRNLLAHGINPLGHAVMRRNRKFHALALVIGRNGGIGRDRGVGRKNHLRRHRRKVIDRNERNRVPVVIDHTLNSRFVGGERDDLAFIRLLDIARHAEIALRTVDTRQRKPVFLRQIQYPKHRRDETVVIQISRDAHLGNRSGIRRIFGIIVRNIDHDTLLSLGHRRGEFCQRVVFILPGSELRRDGVQPLIHDRRGQLIRLMAAA